jgi:hypothetical protein
VYPEPGRFRPIGVFSWSVMFDGPRRLAASGWNNRDQFCYGMLGPVASGDSADS